MKTDSFRWGAATASYQIEGAVREGGRQPSIWDTFSHTPGRVAHGDNGDVACDHYHRWAEDVGLLADLGVNAYRFSLAWGRMVDSAGRPNQAGIDFYSRLIDALLQRNITPVVTLYHWDLPQILDDAGGWLNRDTAYRFADYAAIAVAQLGDRVNDWTTLNEPWCSSFLSYAAGQHAPGHTSPGEALRAAHHLNLAHGLGVQAIRSEHSNACVSVVCNLHAIFPASDSTADIAAAERLRRVGNDIWTGPMLDGKYPAGLMDETAAYSDWSFVHDDDLAIIRQPLDAFGVNYYSSSHVFADKRTLTQRIADAGPTCWVADYVDFKTPSGPLTAMGWNIDPAALTWLLKDFAARWPGLPVFISENGAAFDDLVTPDGVHDQARIDYIEAHIHAVEAAMASGVPVTGYFVWSLLDNFEWALGFSRRFGLVWVDYATQKRTPKDSYTWYQERISRH
ncbi:MAG: GH1 family beta-glucosidase [Propionibacteriaceae bacterium]|nr:GH1 family beta-glucosidase [Propionibacteriaceae bacterium]